MWDRDHVVSMGLRSTVVSSIHRYVSYCIVLHHVMSNRLVKTAIVFYYYIIFAILLSFSQLYPIGFFSNILTSYKPLVILLFLCDTTRVKDTDLMMYQHCSTRQWLMSKSERFPCRPLCCWGFSSRHSWVLKTQ